MIVSVSITIFFTFLRSKLIVVLQQCSIIHNQQTYQDDRQEALETIQNMRMSAMLIEEGEIKKGYKGLVILEAYYGAIENIVDPNASIEDIVCLINATDIQAFGRVLDVKIPLLCQIEDSKIFHKSNTIFVI